MFELSQKLFWWHTIQILYNTIIVEKKGSANYKPQRLHEFSLYLDGNWYSLTARQGTYDDTDAIGVLDVDISSRLILDKLMGIKDLRSDNRIDSWLAWKHTAIK